MNRFPPHQIDTTGATAGQALIYNPAVDEYAPSALPAAGVAAIVAGTGISINSTDPAHPIISAAIPTQLVPLTTVVGGVPDLVWDADNQLVMTEDH